MSLVTARAIGVNAIALCAFASNAIAQSVAPSCFRYEPDTVRIIGILEKRTYPGAPSYESTSTGDAPESGFYLALSQPICTQGGGASRENEPHSDVRRVQLVAKTSTLNDLAARVGKRVTLRGTLFSAHSGHHHASILVTVLSPVETVNDSGRLVQIRT